MSNKQEPYDELEAYKKFQGKQFKSELNNCNNFPCGEFECKHGSVWICAHLYDEKTQQLTHKNKV